MDDRAKELCCASINVNEVDNTVLIIGGRKTIELRRTGAEINVISRGPNTTPFEIQSMRSSSQSGEELRKRKVFYFLVEGTSARSER